MYEQINADHQASSYHTSQLYENLPTEFTRDLLKVTLERLGQLSPVKNVIYRWQKMGWIIKLGKDQYQKIQK